MLISLGLKMAVSNYLVILCGGQRVKMLWASGGLPTMRLIERECIR